MKAIDLSGQKFGKLTVVERTVNPNNKKKVVYWKCICDCGNESIVTSSALKSDKIQQCWKCAHYASNFGKRKDLAGEVFGWLTVLQMIYPERCDNTNTTKLKKTTKALCKCRWGNVIERKTDTLIHTRKTGAVASCGCYRKQIALNQTKDVIGERFGRLTALSYIHDDSNIVKVLCKCDCGKEKVIAKRDLMAKHTLSCGCLRKERQSLVNTKDFTDIVAASGTKFIKPAYQTKRGVWLWECECGECRNHFIALPAKILSGHTSSCGCSSISAGARFIESVLKENDVIYKTEQSLEGCSYKQPLFFDFLLYKEDGSILCAIEYDGRQHYDPVDFFGGEEQLKITQARDSAKNNYCKNNNIPLVRIPYYFTNDEIKQALLNIINP